jgi:hypothetical protein
MGGMTAQADGAAPNTPEPDAALPRGITLAGKQLLVDGTAFHIRGVCWNPIARGLQNPDGLDFAGATATDLPLMAEIGLNAVRTYSAITDVAVLDALYAQGIRVLNSVYAYGGEAPQAAVDRIAPIKDHPAILMWLLGNEWNYNGLYTGLSHADALARLNEVAELLRDAGVRQPIATVYGELPSEETIAAMPRIDVWGINSYRGIGFGDLFSSWAARSNAPMFIAEYGADAYNATLPGYDPDSQAQAVLALTNEIAAQSSALTANGVALGGTLFEWADEWWKDPAGGPNTHDVGGTAPGGGPYPDQTFNEEWWGIVDIDRQPRAAFTALRDAER